MSLISKIQSLISSANAVTGESRTDLTACVQDLKDGYGGSTVEKGLVFSEYDSDGYPHKAEFVGMTSIGGSYLYATLTKSNLFKEITSLAIPDGITLIDSSAIRSCTSLTSIEFPNNDIKIRQQTFMGDTGLTSIEIKKNVVFDVNSNFQLCSNLVTVSFGGEVNEIKSSAFASCNNVMLYDFSHCSAVPPLYNVASLGHANGCVIKIPLALSDQTLGTGNGWESQTNWSALTDVVWQGV